MSLARVESLIGTIKKNVSARFREAKSYQTENGTYVKKAGKPYTSSLIPADVDIPLVLETHTKITAKKMVAAQKLLDFAVQENQGHSSGGKAEVKESKVNTEKRRSPFHFIIPTLYYNKSGRKIYPEIGVDLLTYLRRLKKKKISLNPEQFKSIIGQMIKIIEVLHSNNIRVMGLSIRNFNIFEYKGEYCVLLKRLNNLKDISKSKRKYKEQAEKANRHLLGQIYKKQPNCNGWSKHNNIADDCLYYFMEESARKEIKPYFSCATVSCCDRELYQLKRADEIENRWNLYFVNILNQSLLNNVYESMHEAADGLLSSDAQQGKTITVEDKEKIKNLLDKINQCLQQEKDTQLRADLLQLQSEVERIKVSLFSSQDICDLIKEALASYRQELTALTPLHGEDGKKRAENLYKEIELMVRLGKTPVTLIYHLDRYLNQTNYHNGNNYQKSFKACLHKKLDIVLKHKDFLYKQHRAGLRGLQQEIKEIAADDEKQANVMPGDVKGIHDVLTGKGSNQSYQQTYTLLSKAMENHFYIKPLQKIKNGFEFQAIENLKTEDLVACIKRAVEKFKAVNKLNKSYNSFSDKACAKLYSVYRFFVNDFEWHSYEGAKFADDVLVQVSQKQNVSDIVKYLQDNVFASGNGGNNNVTSFKTILKESLSVISSLPLTTWLDILPKPFQPQLN